VGSPEAPAIAPPADPDRVPALLGLRLSDAEQRVRDSGMILYVTRVAGQPVGRVLSQDPAAGSPRPPAGVVQVVVTAGGDAVAAVPPAPAVEVDRIAVPDLLDRTGPQAQRICEDLGLVAVLDQAERGPPGRVADQRPAAGAVVPKGSEVRVFVAPPPVRSPQPGPGPATPPASPRDEAPPDGPPPAPPGPGAGEAPGMPVVIAPQTGTEVGRETNVALGLSWRPVPGADGYLVEVEEQGAEGWLPNVRRPARQAAVVVEIERFAPRPGPLRWRVRALRGGRQGVPCAWVVLR
jgi:beta-lactam-binding protein with PASTA domain